VPRAESRGGLSAPLRGLHCKRGTTHHSWGFTPNPWPTRVGCRAPKVAADFRHRFAGCIASAALLTILGVSPQTPGPLAWAAARRKSRRTFGTASRAALQPRHYPPFLGFHPKRLAHSRGPLMPRAESRGGLSAPLRGLHCKRGTTHHSWGFTPNAWPTRVDH
jgi:hypothetical protein